MLDDPDPRVIALTGGPGGGKSALLQRLTNDPCLRDRVAIAEEAIHGVRFVRMDPRTAEFQCALVAIQAGTEAGLLRALKDTDKRVLVTHHGTLDPCAFWQSFGHSPESFFEMTGTTLEDHYRRYTLVIHMETAAARVPQAYVRYPHAHRPESVQQAVRLDGLLGDLWGRHPYYVRIEATPNFGGKMASGLNAIRNMLDRR